MANCIINRISPRFDPACYLRNILGISQASINRRIRGEIPFTFDEIAELSIYLGFSVDELIVEYKCKNMFDMQKC